MKLSYIVFTFLYREIKKFSFFILNMKSLLLKYLNLTAALTGKLRRHSD